MDILLILSRWVILWGSIAFAVQSAMDYANIRFNEIRDIGWEERKHLARKGLLHCAYSIFLALVFVYLL